MEAGGGACSRSGVFRFVVQKSPFLIIDGGASRVPLPPNLCFKLGWGLVVQLTGAARVQTLL